MSLIKAIKTGQRQLGWDNETYRAVLHRLTGKTSARNLTLIEAEQVIKYMRKNGFKPLPKCGKRPDVTKDKKAIFSKIEAIVLNNQLNWDYVKGISNKMFNQPVVEWLDYSQLHSLLKALIYHVKRHGGKYE